MNDFIYRLVISMLLVMIAVASLQAIVSTYYWINGISTVYYSDDYKCVTVYTPKESTSCFVIN